MSTIPPISGFPTLRVTVVDIIRLKQKADRIKFQFDTPFDPYFDPDGQSRGISDSMYDDLLVLSRYAFRIFGILCDSHTITDMIISRMKPRNSCGMSS